MGSPQEVIDKTLTFQEGFGDYQRQLFAVDSMGLPVELALEQVELLGTEVVPVLRKEMAARRSPDAAEAPVHATLVAAKYGDAEPRQPRPNPNRGDNLSGASPYQDSDPEFEARFPRGGLIMASDIRLANEAWEAMFRAQATFAREFTAADIWEDLQPNDYGVLYALSTAPEGLRISELCDDVLLTQPGMSRLIARLEARGLVERRGRSG